MAVVEAEKIVMVGMIVMIVMMVSESVVLDRGNHCLLYLKRLS